MDGVENVFHLPAVLGIGLSWVPQEPDKVLSWKDLSDHDRITLENSENSEGEVLSHGVQAYEESPLSSL